MNREPLPAGSGHRLASTRIGRRKTRLERPRRDSPSPSLVVTIQMRVARVHARLDLMTAAVKAVLEQAKRLTREERDELVGELLDLDALQPPPLGREERDRQIAEGLAQIEHGEGIDEDTLFAELEAL